MIESTFSAQILTAAALVPMGALSVYCALRVRSGKMKRWPKTIGNSWPMVLAVGVVVFTIGLANLCAAILRVIRD